MMVDSYLTTIFQIPKRMLQKWKNSNDYKYLIYSFLKFVKKEDVESFFDYMLFSNNSKILFSHKDDFLEKVDKNINKLFEYKIINFNIDSKNRIDKDDNIESQSRYSLIYEFNKNSVVYVELTNRIQDIKPLKSKISQLKRDIGKNRNLKHIIFITSEKIPLYIKKNDFTIEDVNIIDINSDKLVNTLFKAEKLIFVPSDIDIKNLQRSPKSLIGRINMKLHTKIMEVKDKLKEIGIKEDATIELIFHIIKLSKDKNLEDLDKIKENIYNFLFSDDIKKYIKEMIKKDSFSNDTKDRNLISDNTTINTMRNGMKKFKENNLKESETKIYRSIVEFFYSFDQESLEYLIFNYTVVENEIRGKTFLPLKDSQIQ